MRADLKWDSYWGSAAPSIIDEYEKRLGRKFPPDYKTIVSANNGAFVDEKDAFQFLSNLTKKNETHGLGLLHAFGECDVYSETIEYSLSHKPFGFPDGVVSFARGGGGDLLCFDYRGCPSPDAPKIIVWHLGGEPGTIEESSPVANSFDELLSMLFEE
jgi:hypothetical protein